MRFEFLRRIVFPFYLLFIIARASCASTIYIGNGERGYSNPQNFPITPEKAFQLAEPYLDRTYELRKKRRHSVMTHPLRDYIVARGDWYYICRDNYPYKTFDAYRFNAVRVHVKTGECIPPDQE